jgi:hypothetical protein
MCTAVLSYEFQLQPDLASAIWDMKSNRPEGQTGEKSYVLEMESDVLYIQLYNMKICCPYIPCCKPTFCSFLFLLLLCTVNLESNIALVTEYAGLPSATPRPP